MKDIEVFRIMRTGIKCAVGTVPLWYAEQFNVQAEINHSQSIQRLNERGGLTPTEFYLVANGLAGRDWVKYKEEFCIAWLEDQYGLLAQIERLTAELEQFKELGTFIEIKDAIKAATKFVSEHRECNKSIEL